MTWTPKPVVRWFVAVAVVVRHEVLPVVGSSLPLVAVPILGLEIEVAIHQVM